MNKYLNINWIDGMKINKQHFIHCDNVRQYEMQTQTATFLKSYEYGLLPLPNSEPILHIEDNHLCLHHCSALTKYGQRIEVGPDQNIKMDLSAMDAKWNQLSRLMVTISADPYQREATGTPDLRELPPRQPYSLPTLSFGLADPTQIKTDQFANQIVILGSLVKVMDTFTVDGDYLPPCRSIFSHPALLKRYMAIEEMVASIGMHSIQVVKNARSKKRRGEINDLADNTFYLMEKIVFFLAHHMNHIRTLYKEESPIYLFSFLNSFGRVILTALKCLRSVDREALLRYYESHLGYQPSQFESDVQSLSQIKYDHLRLNDIFDEAERCLLTLKGLVSKAVNLEYHSVERVDVLEEKRVKKSKLDIF